MTGFILPLRSSNAQAHVGADTTDKVGRFHQNIFAFYELKWRQNILWVAPNANQTAVESANVQELVDRLKHSSVRCVCIDTNLSEAHVKAWSSACNQANKKFHLRDHKGAAQRALQPQKVKRSLRHWLGQALPNKALARFGASF